MKIPYKTSNHKYQTKLDFSLVTQNHESEEKSCLEPKEPHYLTFEEFKALDSMKGMKDEEIMVLYEKAQKRRQ